MPKRRWDEQPEGVIVAPPAPPLRAVGRGVAATKPAWMVQREAAGAAVGPPSAPARSVDEPPDSGTNAEPSRPAGRGVAATKPAWMAEREAAGGPLSAPPRSTDGPALKPAPAPAPFAKPPPPLYFDVMRGDDSLGRLDLSGAARLTFGRDAPERVDVPLDHPSASRHHATMVFERVADGPAGGTAPAAYLRDEGSTHGTTLDGRRLPARGDGERLRPGMVVRFGESTRSYVYREASAAAAGPAAGPAVAPAPTARTIRVPPLVVERLTTDEKRALPLVAKRTRTDIALDGEHITVTGGSRDVEQAEYELSLLIGQMLTHAEQQRGLEDRLAGVASSSARGDVDRDFQAPQFRYGTTHLGWGSKQPRERF